ncbi:hypothetical protein ACJX0J_041265, partial [Zea mays]
TGNMIYYVCVPWLNLRASDIYKEFQTNLFKSAALVCSLFMLKDMLRDHAFKWLKREIEVSVFRYKLTRDFATVVPTIVIVIKIQIVLFRI